MDKQISELLKYGIVLVLLIGVFFGGTYIMKTILGTKYPVMVVVSESMVPTLGVGDFIIVAQIQDFDKINVGPPPEGDILVFVRSNYDEYIVHRAVEGDKINEDWFFRTKGDNNNHPDPLPVYESNVKGKVIGRIPILGYFTLFIKTMKGFVLIAGFMIISFLLDYLLPPKNEKEKEGHFPWLILLPLIIPFIIVTSLWVIEEGAIILEIIAIFSWYVGCLLLPLAFWDDDTSIMVWLYHLVLFMIPITCDIVWWTKNITPSMWWAGESSTVPITWLLMNETAAFQRAFMIILSIILPGSFIYFFTLITKRYNTGPMYKLSRLIRKT